MKLKFGNLEIILKDFVTSVSSRSKSTGKEIEKISSKIKLKGNNLKDEFLEILKNKDKDNIYSIDNEGMILKKFKVSSNSWSYTGTNPDENTIFNFNLELEEIEELNIKNLIISGKTYVPYEYSEDFDKESLIINAKIKINLNEINELIIEKSKKDEIYFPVIREGINNTEKSMRFGQIYWSKNNSEYKYDLVLVEKSYDENKKRLRNKFHTKEANESSSLAFTNNLLHELTKLLIDKKTISEKEVEILRKISEEKIVEKIRNFYEMDDIDK